MRIVIEAKEWVSLKELHAAYIRAVYEDLGRNKVHTAKTLKISVRTLRIWQKWLQLPARHEDDESYFKPLKVRLESFQESPE